MIGSRSIFFSQVMTNLAITIVLILVLHAPLLYINYTERLTREQSFYQTVKIANQLSTQLQVGKIPPMETWSFFSRATNSILWLTDDKGLPIGGIAPEEWVDDYGAFDFSPQQGGTIQVKNINKKIYIMRIPLIFNNNPVYLFAQYNDESLYSYAWERYKMFYFLPLLIGIFAAVIIGIILSRKLTYGIINIAQAAVSFSKGDYNSRTTVTDNSELGRLGRTLNNMANLILHTQETRREFYANISHDLKTPITCIQAMTEALIDGIAKNPKEYKQYLEKIHRETQRMSRLVNDLLDIEKLESGKSDLRLGKVDLKMILARQTDKMQQMLEEHALSLTVDLKTDKKFIIADKDRLIQIFDNLLSNAIRHSPPGAGIEISLQEVNGRFSLAIADQGTGIAADEIPFIWERFYRGDKSRNSVLGSSGLGLTITRSLVEAMAGDITVTSTIGIGSIFTITFPIVEEE